MKRSILVLTSLVVASQANAAVDLTTLWAEVDFSTVATNVVAIGVTAVGIAVALKAISLAKRAVSKA
ncbi:phage coat protein [Vibrio breoganii]